LAKERNGIGSKTLEKLIEKTGVVESNCRLSKTDVWNWTKNNRPEIRRVVEHGHNNQSGMNKSFPSDGPRQWEVRCYKCNGTGHIVRNCPMTERARQRMPGEEAKKGKVNQVYSA
jgi:Zinc knuckle